jgi:hypothetical protein
VPADPSGEVGGRFGRGARAGVAEGAATPGERDGNGGDEDRRREEDRRRREQESVFAAASASAAGVAARGGVVTVTRRTAKVGRNDPCPFGPGKKHKQCHGAVAVGG